MDEARCSISETCESSPSLVFPPPPGEKVSDSSLPRERKSHCWVSTIKLCAQQPNLSEDHNGVQKPFANCRGCPTQASRGAQDPFPCGDPDICPFVTRHESIRPAAMPRLISVPVKVLVIHWLVSTPYSPGTVRTCQCSMRLLLIRILGDVASDSALGLPSRERET